MRKIADMDAADYLAWKLREEMLGGGHVEPPSEKELSARFRKIILERPVSAAQGQKEGETQESYSADHWCPKICPITGREFFMWLETDEGEYVPTYGGPYDSYTIPECDEDGSWCCQRYDHDDGAWVEGWEDTGLIVTKKSAASSAPVPEGWVLDLNEEAVFELIGWATDSEVKDVAPLTLHYEVGCEGLGLYVSQTEYPSEGHVLLAVPKAPAAEGEK